MSVDVSPDLVFMSWRPWLKTGFGLKETIVVLVIAALAALVVDYMRMLVLRSKMVS